MVYQFSLCVKIPLISFLTLTPLLSSSGFLSHNDLVAKPLYLNKTSNKIYQLKCKHCGPVVLKHSKVSVILKHMQVSVVLKHAPVPVILNTHVSKHFRGLTGPCGFKALTCPCNIPLFHLSLLPYTLYLST